MTHGCFNLECKGQVSPGMLKCRACVVRERATHELKTWPNEFAAVACGMKRFEIRKNDRNFRVGDVLVLKEWIPGIGCYAGNEIAKVVSFVVNGGEWGIPSDMCVMSIEDDEIGAT